MSIVIKKWVLVLHLVVPMILFAQEEQGKYPIDYDTNYIQDFRHRLNIAMLFELKENTINIINANNKLVNFRANLPLPNYGVMLTYRYLNLSMSIPLPGLSYLPKDKGETKSFALALGLTGRKWYFRNFFEYFKGYYVTNPDNLFPPHLIGNVSNVFPEMESTTYFATVYYGFNGTKYTHRGLVWQSELQKKSAGSFLVGASGGYKNINSPGNIHQPDSITIEDLDKARNIVIGINAGYSHSFVLSKYFSLSLMLIPGFNYTNREYSSNLVEHKEFRNALGFSAEGRVQILFEGGDYYSGLSYTGYLFSDWISNELPVGSSHNYVKLTIGYRFKIKPIKFLKPFGLSN